MFCDIIIKFEKPMGVKKLLSKMRISLLALIRKNTVACIAVAAAVITSFIVKPDKQYINYFDFKTLTCLFCTLAVVCAFKNIHIFEVISRKIVSMFKTVRSAVIALVYITFIGSMILANDMALITFLPLGYFVLSSTNNKKYMAFTFIMQNIAANLGGMITPFGNPQNLYLYSYFNIPTSEFIQIMALPFIISIALITACCFLLGKEELVLDGEYEEKLSAWRVIVYSVLFVFSIMIVFRTVPYYWGLIIVPASLLILDRKALLKVDYGLLLTFCAFFVFSGNMARIDSVNNFLNWLISKNTLVYGVLSCQVISNVPSAILLSKFTQNYQELLVAVNIGGAGTLVASLASLITFREYSKRAPHEIGTYMKLFSAFNFGILIILLIVMGIKFA